MSRNLPLVVWLGAACGARAAERQPSQPVRCPTEPQGERSALTVAPGATVGPDIDPPRFCPERHRGAKSAYIRVRGHGRGTFIAARGPEAGCTTPPTSDSLETCARIDLWSFSESVRHHLAARGVSAIGDGLGTCYEPRRTSWDDTQYSVRIDDWSEADVAVAVVSDELERWGAGQPYGVSVEPILCVGY